MPQQGGGLIQRAGAMQPGSDTQAPAQAGGASQMQAPNPEIMSPIVLEHMDELERMRTLLDGELGDAYDRVLTAGMKTLYAPESAQMVQGLIMDKEVPVGNKLGEGVANLLVMMDNQGNGTIPKEVMVPVGVALMMEAADYLFEIGVEVTEKDLGAGLELLLTGLFTGYGVDPKQIEAMIDDMGQKLGFDDSMMKSGTEADVEASEAAAFNQGFAEDQASREGM